MRAVVLDGRFLVCACAWGCAFPWTRGVVVFRTVVVDFVVVVDRDVLPPWRTRVVRCDCV